MDGKSMGSALAAADQEIEERDEEIARLHKAFRHTHVAGPDGDLDTCRECGLDLRNPVHRREEG